MSRFIETIRAENGCVQSIALHQERVNQTLRFFHSNITVNLTVELLSLSIKFIPTCRIRIEYDLSGVIGIEFFPYTIKKNNSIGIVQTGHRDYRFKYADRSWIHELVSQSGCDEIIMVEGNEVRDASIANLAFFDGREWITPNTPLLAGTMRKKLLEQGVIREAPIKLDMLQWFDKIKLLNAMLTWEKSPELPIGMIRLI